MTDGERTVMVATHCSPQAARSTLTSLSGDVIQAVELLLLSPNDREKMNSSYPEDNTPKEQREEKVVEDQLLGWETVGEESCELHDWRDYIKPPHQKSKHSASAQAGGTSGKTGVANQHSEQTKRKKPDGPTPSCERLQYLRENRQLTNKERKEKNRLEKQVGKELDLCIAKATTAVTEAAADPLPDLGTLLI